MTVNNDFINGFAGRLVNLHLVLGSLLNVVMMRMIGMVWARLIVSALMMAMNIAVVMRVDTEHVVEIVVVVVIRRVEVIAHD